WTQPPFLCTALTFALSAGSFDRGRSPPLSATAPTAPMPVITPDPARTQDRSVSGRRESDPRPAGVAPEGYLFQAAGAQAQLHPWAAPRQARAQKVTPRVARLVKPTRAAV